VRHASPVTSWAIVVEGEVAGGIGLMLQTDVERVSAEIGYWLGEQHWGKGNATEAVTAVTRESFRRFELSRIFALPFADNRGSIRVLEKAGYSHEGTMPRSTIKDGVIRDQLMYGAYRPL
jgi:RimJ/RimL family protein N-acetyltransferase